MVGSVPAGSDDDLGVVGAGRRNTVAGMREWYRTPDWAADAQADFERRLRRARGQRSEYLRIKAAALQEAGLLDEAADLYERFLAEHPDGFGTTYVLELLGDVAREQGRLADAVRRYRDLLALRPLPGQQRHGRGVPRRGSARAG